MREWIVFFGDGERAAWWDVFTRPGFRHVLAVGWDAELRVFVMFDPARERSDVVLRAWGEEDFDLGRIVAACRHAVRFRPRSDRRLTPPMYGCVGAIKALLGVRSRALRPEALFRDLLRLGGECVELPEVEHEGPVRGRQEGDDAAAGGSAHCADAPA